MPDFLVSSVSEKQYILPTHSAVKLNQLVCSISGPGNKELSQLAKSLPLLHLEGTSRAHPSPRLLDIGVLSTCVGCVRHTLLLIRHGWPLVELVQHLSNLWQQSKTWWNPRNTESYGTVPMELGADFCPPPPQSDKKKTHADVSSIYVSWSGGGWETPSIEISYRESRGAENRKGSSTLTESSRVT